MKTTVMKTAKKSIIILIAVSVIASALSIGASPDQPLAYGAATVDTSNLNLRSGPSLTHPVIMMLNEGDIVVILERTNSE